MQLFTAAITAFAVLAHTALGCCPCGGHALELFVTPAGQGDTALAGMVPPAPAKPSVDDDDGTSDDPHHCCCERRHWSASSGAPVTHTLVGALAWADAGCGSSIAPDAHDARRQFLRALQAPPAPPVRAHLSKSVLLI